MKLLTRNLGLVDYGVCWQAMREFTASRAATTSDELWVVQHPPVFTLGRAGRHEHVLAAGAIPLVHSDRGGQVTYHGPGQLVIYVLLDVARLGIGPRELVRRLEQGVIAYLASVGVSATRRAGAPGVYVDEAKIAALGLRLRNGCSYHGLALNVDMDLEPFQRINPCGYAGLRVTQLKDVCPGVDFTAVVRACVPQLAHALFAEVDIELQWSPRRPAVAAPVA